VADEDVEGDVLGGDEPGAVDAEDPAAGPPLVAPGPVDGEPDVDESVAVPEPLVDGDGVGPVEPGVPVPGAVVGLGEPLPVGGGPSVGPGPGEPEDGPVEGDAGPGLPGDGGVTCAGRDSPGGAGSTGSLPMTT
jgi:hypothetical protein